MKTCNECNVNKDESKFELMEGKWLRHKCNECRSAKYSPMFRLRHPKYFMKYSGPGSKSKVKETPQYKLYQHFLYIIRKGKCEKFGWSRFEFRTYIESLFRDGMNWDNWGSVWHINHKRSALEMIRLGYSESEINSLSNLEPLLRRENLKQDRTKVRFLSENGF